MENWTDGRKRSNRGTSGLKGSKSRTMGGKSITRVSRRVSSEKVGIIKTGTSQEFNFVGGN